MPDDTPTAPPDEPGATPPDLDPFGASSGDHRRDAGYVGFAFRQCHPDHAGLAETVRASAAYPSRFTPPCGRFGVLYVALAPETAAAELRRRADQLGVPVAALAPRAMLTLAVRLRRVLDLTNVAVRDAWGLTPEDLAGDDYARCQEVAVAARADGYEAIRYPSAAVVRERSDKGDAPESDNLAVFADTLPPGSDVRVVRSELLPLNDG
ncbi:MAG TPA: RES family NAD+ phosphorylase [Gemmatirosa sp.]